MTPPFPDWLKARNGELRPTVDGTSVLVYFQQEPQYELTPLPVRGKFGCRINQTVNGKALVCKDVFPSAPEALRDGLDTLRTMLGW